MTRRLALGSALLIGTIAAIASHPFQARDVSGEWILRLYSPPGGAASASTLELTQDGDSVRGRNISNIGTVRSVEGRVRGDSVSFAVPIMTGDERFVRYSGVLVTPDSIDGKADLVGQSTGNFTATRKP